MARQNVKATRPRVTGTSPVTSTLSNARTGNGALGSTRDVFGELFLLAVSNMVSEGTFYEAGSDRNERFRSLIHKAVQVDAAQVAAMLRWLRSNRGNMRTVSIVGAAEYAKAVLVAWGEERPVEVPSPRSVVDSVIQRADEPGEMLAYWINQYGRNVPKPVKRGVGDAIIRLGTEFNYLKWDSDSRGIRFADVLNIVHPGDKKGSNQKLKGAWQHDLFGYAVAKPHREVEIPESLGVMSRRAALMAMPVNERRALLEDPDVIRDSGMTWEALAGWLQGPMDKLAWEAMIPKMGFMALMRNVRNFDQAGVSDWAVDQVVQKFQDPEQVAKSRQLPLRFLSAYRAAPSLRWSQALEVGLNLSLNNVPELPGRTLILVDRSGSMMWSKLSDRSELTYADAAAIFGSALALRSQKPTLIQYGSGHRKVTVDKGGSVLKMAEKFGDMGGTNTWATVRETFDKHDRVVILTDEQSSDSYRAADIKVPVYTWNLAGYRVGSAPSGTDNRHTFGGLQDAAFRMIPLLERGRNADYPWND